MTTLKKVCDLCKQATNAEGHDLIYFGEWMTKSDITVHYFCLLLSTHLPQEGADNAGILGFLLRDIRKEAQMANSRRCMYCDKAHANIMCNGCKGYFHLTCGFSSFALTQFKEQFRSYCYQCIPHDDVWAKLKIENPPIRKYKCFICMDIMGACEPSRWIYAKCCGNGFVHSRCMKSYALKAGYYLCCLWCKDKRFRDDVKDMGVFVPDRDANWEREKGAYQDLHRGHQRCDMAECHCPQGRDYKNGRRWTIIICQLCGSFGAHNPTCIPGMESSKDKTQIFKCETCSATERTVLSQSSWEEAIVIEDSNGINTTLYIQKVLHTNSSFERPTQIPASVENTFTPVHIPTLTQCDEATECQSGPLDCTVGTVGENNMSDRNQSENATATNSNESEKPDPKVIGMLVGQLLGLFEPKD